MTDGPAGTAIAVASSFRYHRHLDAESGRMKAI